MAKPILYRTELEVSAKLSQFGITLDDAIRVVRAVVTAHNDAVPFDPSTTAGQFRYIYGTRTVREIWCGLGWKIDRLSNIESVFDSKSGTKIVYQNVDCACDEKRSPKAISDKGEASKKLIQRSTSAYLFPEMEAEDEERMETEAIRANATTWYFCVSVNGDDVRAELSLPYSVEQENFSTFIERIFIVLPGDWGGDGMIDLDDDSDAIEFEPIVSKK